MRHRVDHRKLGRTSKHRLALMRNMVASLLEHGRITTTLPKAKEARRYAEKVITLGKKALAATDRAQAATDQAQAATDRAQALHYRRQALSALHSPAAVKQLIEKVAPVYKERKGGYTRVLKAGFRLGDHGAIAIFELV
jgi:large subunit ribosomal protein L17